MMLLDREWFERMLKLRKKIKNEDLEERERASAEKAFSCSLKRIKVEVILKKKREELRYLPLGWVLETMEIF